MSNIHRKTVDSFGDEWSRFKQTALEEPEKKYLFNTYFSIFPWEDLPINASGFDMGCGSGRWAAMVAPKVDRLYCIDPSPAALEVAEKALAGLNNAQIICAGVSDAVLPSGSQDFGYSLGVLHHVPDTAAGLKACVEMLKPGAPFLVYLYYRFDNRPKWYAWLWRLSEVLRYFIKSLPSPLKAVTTDAIALAVYLPFARTSKLLSKIGLQSKNIPLSTYQNTSFYTMRTDARDRFGTPLEQRFTKIEIEKMLSDAGLVDIRFSDSFPYWCAVGKKGNMPT